MNMFQLDGETIVRVLRQRKSDGTISAEITPQIMSDILKIKETGIVAMTFQKGEVVACRLSTGSGRVCTEDPEKLSQLLSLAGVLHWQLGLSPAITQGTGLLPAIRPVPPDPSLVQRSALPAPMPVFWNWIPYRVREIYIDQIQDMTLRRIYQLVDGQRSIEKLSILSRMPPQTIALALQQLRLWGLIEFHQH